MRARLGSVLRVVTYFFFITLLREGLSYRIGLGALHMADMADMGSNTPRRGLDDKTAKAMRRYSVNCG